jgi:glycoside/pentoside/hexuronide:cation symporter, GPH family
MTTSQEKLSRRTKLMYGVGDAGINLADTVVGLLFAIFLTDVVGLRPALAAVALFVGRSADYLNDPIIGYLSDRTRTRWGRRRPFILFGMIPFALVYMLMWWKPPFDSQVALAVYYAVAFVLYDTAATILYMPYFAMTPELTSDYDERTKLTTYRMAFSILGALIGYVVPLAIIGTMDPHSASKVLSVGAGVAFVSILPMVMVFFGTREREEFQKQEQPSLKASLKAAVKNKPFLYAIGIFLLTWTAFDVLQTVLLYYLKYRLNLAGSGDLIFGVLFIAALVSLPFWSWLSGRWDKRKAYISAMAFLAVIMIMLGFMHPSWGLLAMGILSGLAGFGVGAIQLLTWSMIPDAVEWDEYQTGQRHEGMFYSLVTTFRKVAVSISIPLAMLMLDWTGYVANADVQPHSAILGLQMLIGPIPAVCLLGGIVLALLYPLNRARHAELRAKLAERQAEQKN